MKKFDILVIGGGPAGLVAALEARRIYPAKRVGLVRKEKRALIPCAIPYLPDRLGSIEKDLVDDQIFKDKKIELIIDEVISLNLKSKKAFLKSKQELVWEKLVLATGSQSRSIPLKGRELKNVYQIHKDQEYLERFREAIVKAQKIVIIGGGFIGVELAEEISRMKEKEVAIVESLDHCLAVNFDQEFGQKAEERLREQGIKLFTGKEAQEIVGQNRVEGVKLTNGKTLPADLVVIAIGSQPNVLLAQESGLKTDPKFGIWVDRYQRAKNKDVFAIGDCAQTRDIVTGHKKPILLASTACFEARLAARNLYRSKERLVRNQGAIGAFNTYLNGLVLGAAGLTEKQAKEEKIDYLISKAKSPSCHPASLPGSEEILVKLVFSKKEQILIGGQIAGRLTVAEIPYLFSIAIKEKLTANQLADSQPATHPLLTAAPTCYPLINAAQSVVNDKS